MRLSLLLPASLESFLLVCSSVEMPDVVFSVEQLRCGQTEAPPHTAAPEDCLMADTVDSDHHGESPGFRCVSGCSDAEEASLACELQVCPGLQMVNRLLTRSHFFFFRFCQAVVPQSIQAGRSSRASSGSVHAAAAAASGAHLRPHDSTSFVSGLLRQRTGREAAFIYVVSYLNRHVCVIFFFF